MSQSADVQLSGRMPLRQEQRQLTRRRLVAAARAAFEADGYVGVAVGAIADAAGVNRATFYLHFNNKAEVFLEVLQEQAADTAKYWRALDRALTAGSSQAMREWLTMAMQWWRGNAKLLPAYRQALAVEPAVANQTQAELDLLSEELVGYLGQFAEEKRAAAALRIELMVMQLGDVFYRHLILGQPVADPDDLLEVLTDMWCRAASTA